MGKYTLLQYLEREWLEESQLLELTTLAWKSALKELFDKPVFTGIDNDTLRQKTSPIDISNELELKSISAWATLMWELVDYYPIIWINAWWLAAIQIGIQKAFFVSYFDKQDVEIIKWSKTKQEIWWDEDKVKLTIINPEIVEISSKVSILESGEACLSLPGIWWLVPRPDWVVVRFWDTKWNEYIMRFNWNATPSFLHEYDHLQGKLYSDKAIQLYLFDNTNKVVKKPITINQLKKIWDLTFNFYKREE